MPLTGPNSFFRQRNAINDRSSGISDAERAQLLLKLAEAQDVDARQRGVAAAGGRGARFAAQNILSRKPSTLSMRPLTPHEAVQMQEDVADRQAARQAHAGKLRTRQGMVEKQWGKLVDAMADPRNPLTQEEAQGAVEQFQNMNNTDLLGTINPIWLRRRNEEADDAQLDVVNTAAAWSEQLGLPQEQVSSFFGQPANGKFFTQSEKKAAFDMAREASGQDPSAGLVNASKAMLKRADDKMLAFKEANPDFSPNAPKLVAGTGSSLNPFDNVSEEQVVAQRALKEEYDAIKDEQARHERRLRTFAGLADDPGTDSAPPPPPAGSGAAPPPPDYAKAPGFTKENAIPATDENVEQVWTAAQRLATQEKRTLYITTSDGTIFEINPEQ